MPRKLATRARLEKHHEEGERAVILSALSAREGSALSAREGCAPSAREGSAADPSLARMRALAQDDSACFERGERKGERRFRRASTGCCTKSLFYGARSAVILSAQSAREGSATWPPGPPMPDSSLR